MNITDRPATHSTYYPNRPVRGVVIHDEESHLGVTTFGSEGGWHFSIDRDGTVWGDVSLDWCAWHVRACDRWRPDWMLDAPDKGVSAANFCSLGIELVSDLAWRQSGVAYTDEQYTSLIALLGYLKSLFGPLPHVTHGSLQSDRSDPVGFEPTRANLGPFVPGQGYSLLETVTPQDMSLQTDYDALNGIKVELENQLAAVRTELVGVQSQNGALTNDVILPLRAQVTQLGEQLTQAQSDLSTARQKIQTLEAASVVPAQCLQVQATAKAFLEAMVALVNGK